MIDTHFSNTCPSGRSCRGCVIAPHFRFVYDAMGYPCTHRRMERYFRVSDYQAFVSFGSVVQTRNKRIITIIT